MHSEPRPGRKNPVALVTRPLLLAAALVGSVLTWCSPLWALDLRFDQPFGHLLELFPLTNPSTTKLGEIRRSRLMSNGSCLTNSCVQGRAAADSASDSANAVEALQRFYVALGAGDTAAALALFAHDAIILESGEIQTRQEYASHHLGADIEFARSMKSRRTISRVDVKGDVAWIAASSIVRGVFRGRALNLAAAELAVLARGPNGWQIRAIHWSSYARRTQ